eukprot:CAMPEP_0206583068 /NCGR_PEP_ID=MMETSP0325_2-20121206/34873_1 /ASSEMBLY_ACC=CAM_ASM_000347 /TAXON_ID=2866 /ORGANISM="Crypthecodinium cohnii, Strain Seligo" /LENGTH=62 /DNA_ID=CAMNT_0054089897 /DNA_START=80 /DNA_END=268 /DNA_ORIENTATION=-
MVALLAVAAMCQVVFDMAVAAAAAAGEVVRVVVVVAVALALAAVCPCSERRMASTLVDLVPV